MSFGGLGTSDSKSQAENYSNLSTSGELSPITAGRKNHVVMGNETNVTNKNKTSVQANTTVKKGGTITVNNGLGESQVGGILDKIGETLKTNLGGSGGSGGGGSSGGTTVAYATPPSIANGQTQADATKASIKWVLGVTAVIALGALWFLSRKKKS